MATEGIKIQRKTKEGMDKWGEKRFGNTECDGLGRLNPEPGRLENGDGGGENS